MRRFSLSFVVWPGIPIVCVLPVDALVLNEQHFAEPAAQLQRPDDAVVHQRPDVFVLPRVHDQRRIEEPLLLFA